jgi:hypothetical protein
MVSLVVYLIFDSLLDLIKEKQIFLLKNGQSMGEAPVIVNQRKAFG